MSSKNFFVIVYDISSDKRRVKLHNKLEDYGSPIQYSVFECLLTPKEYEKLKAEVKKITRPAPYQSQREPDGKPGHSG